MGVTRGKEPINSGDAIDSFRNMGFSTLAAICEILDNSIQAEATKIKVIIDWEKPLALKYQRAKKFVFIDNGHGMDKDVLHNCLVMGESTRRASSGIGKFGVGATFAGISHGKNIRIFSKAKSGQWNFVQLDLELLQDGEGILEPISQDPPPEYSQELDNHGTIVIWDKIDKDFSDKAETLEELHHDLGRIYRKFLTVKKLHRGELIDNKNIITISVDGKNIAPYDPLYLTYNPKSDDTEEVEFASKEYTVGTGKSKSKMWITFSKLPKAWWEDPDMYKPGIVPVNVISRKITERNEGISLIREDREMAFGEIPYLKLYKEDGSSGIPFDRVDRWTGVEVSFTRDADEAFGVEANKSRMLISPEARKKIGTALRSVLEERRKEFTRIRGEKEKESGKSSVKRPGAGSKRVIQGALPQRGYTDDEKRQLREAAERFATQKQEIEDHYNDLIKGYLPLFDYNLDPTGPFVSFEHEQDSIVVRYNMGHPFIEKIFQVFNDIAVKRGEKPDNALTVEEVKKIKILFDILLAAYGLSESTFENPAHRDRIEDTLSTMKTIWSDLMSRLSKQDFDSGS